MHSRSKIFGLINETLSAVSFVQDYVEFHFDEKVVRSLTPPLLVKQEEISEFPNYGSRDRFCSLIGHTVNDVRLDEETSIVLIFELETKLVIPLLESKRTGPEAAHFVPGYDQAIEVW